MENLGKKVGYLKGLMEGMDFSDSPAKGKLFQAMAELMEAMAERLETLEEVVDDLNDYVESIDDDLALLEGNGEDDFNIMDADDDDYEDFEDDFERGEDQLHLLSGKQSEDIAEEDETLAGSVCPECEKMFFVSLSDDESARYECPHCGKVIVPAPLTPENAPIARPVEK